tara:strand:- start:53 stop:715 length:663 start_codon:yes stop_codon:yes gene_type:complete
MLEDNNLKKFSFPANNYNVASNGFYLDSSFNRLIIELVSSYKNLANKFFLAHNSHFHSLSYRILKIIAEKKYFKTNNKRQNFSNLWDYDKTRLNSVDIEELKYENLVSQWKNFIASSSSNGAKAIVIIQPVPQLYKNLTLEEKEFTKHRDYKKIFLKMAEEAEKLRLNENLMVYDFLNIFEQYNETIYQDAIHINTKGNEIMASHLVDILILNKIIKKND